MEQGNLKNENFVLDTKENILYHIIEIDGKKFYTLYLPKKFQNSIISEYHESPLCGHFGVKNTYEKIRRKYFWSKMLDQISEFVKNCHRCQLNKINRKQKPGYCELLEVKQPFSRVEIDITGPYEETPRGNKYVVAAIDCFTKYVEMRAIPSQDKFTIAKFIYEDIITRHSPQLILQSDRGGAFLSEIVEALISVYPPTIQKFSSGYNPNVQGQIERTNATIKEYLRTNIINEEDWDLLIPSCRFSLNTKLNSTTNRTPFELVYNRQPYTFTDIELNFRPKTDKKINLFSPETKQKYKQEIEKVKKRIKEKQIRVAKDYNKKHRQSIYLIGDLVMIRNRHYDINRPRAIQPKFEGPYIVIMKCGRNVYLLQDVFNPDIHRKVNTRLMESYYNKDYKFLEDNPLPNRYLANINNLYTESDADSENSTESETEVYFNSDVNREMIDNRNEQGNLSETDNNEIMENQEFANETHQDTMISQQVMTTRSGRKIKKPKKYQDYILD